MHRPLRSFPGAFAAHPARATLLACGTILAACSGTSADALGPYGSTPASVIAWSGQDQAAPAASALGNPIQVRVVDASGNSVRGATVTLTTTAGTLGTTTGTTGDEGIFQTTFTTGTRIGSDTVTVTVNGVTSPAQFVFGVTAGAPAQLAILAGDQQAATAGATLATPLQIEVEDAYGNPVANTLVLWSADQGKLAATASTTDANGMAQVAFTLGGTPGTDNVTVNAGDAPATKFTEIAN